MIEISNLTKRYGDIAAVDGISFSVAEGEILGFLGPNGAGKSTTMNILTGYLSATSGTVKVNGHDILEEPSEAKRSIGYLPEAPPLYLDMTVSEYLNFICELKGVKKEERTNHLARILRMVRITDVSHRLIGNLSKGYRQRVGIAQAMVGNPPVLVLDEPTVGLDPKQIIDIRSTIKELGKSHTIILSSHILPEVQAVCDRVVIINRGKIVAVDNIGNLSKRGQVNRMEVLVEGPSREVVRRLRQIPGLTDTLVIREADGLSLIQYENELGKDTRRQVFYIMAQNSWPILQMKSMEPTLEDVFLEVTGSAFDRRTVAVEEAQG